MKLKLLSISFFINSMLCIEYKNHVESIQQTNYRSNYNQLRSLLILLRPILYRIAHINETRNNQEETNSKKTENTQEASRKTNTTHSGIFKRGFLNQQTNKQQENNSKKTENKQETPRTTNTTYSGFKRGFLNPTKK